MVGKEIGTPGRPEKTVQVRNRCPGVSQNQAQKALKRFDGDVEKAVLHLQGKGTYLRPLDTTHESQPDEDFSSYLKLPTITHSSSLCYEILYESTFDLGAVVGTLQSEDYLDQISQYLAYYHKDDKQQLANDINGDVQGFPAIFYVVAANDAELIRRWVQYGGDLNATHGASGMPLIAFIILRGDRPRLQSTEILRELLSLGASPFVIPAAFYQRFNRELPEFGPVETDLDDIQEDNKLWCKPHVRTLLSAALSLTQRYLLDRAARVKPVSERKRILARKKNAVALLGLNLLIIGQEMAVDSLKSMLLHHIGMASKEPVVLLFAGPSGHGKTELARRVGDLMSLELHTVDCTMFAREDELFGSKPGYHGADEGAPLNNFLSRKTGETSVVFMDEFEKTSVGVRNALFIPFDQGEYIDRRRSSKVNCSQTIWILATNAFDYEIHSFCVRNKELLKNTVDLRRSPVFTKLVSLLWKQCVTHFGAPLTGRIKEIVPFLTLTPDEAAIVADKRFMELEARFSRPVKLSSMMEDENLVGSIRLDIARDSVVCSNIAGNHYIPELGARSIFSGIERVVCRPLVNMYLDDGDDFAEDQAETRFLVDVNEDNEMEVLPN
ncbi:P-loop containing nucleoside triphosphate hydrolase protein [Astrocystis sublimbata]|nr:P-loop containing nucleoside triphosphate hydrolase protein [Astrocystis sublimbata]